MDITTIVTIADWQALSRRDPGAAACEVGARLSRLSPGQQKAVMAWQVDEAALARNLAAAPDAPLGGVPYLLKDLFAVKGVPTFAGSSFLPEVQPIPLVNGALVKALAQAGAALAGKTHLHEFAYGLTGENAHYGDVAHPHRPDRTSGGSSSGSAAAVAAGVVPFAIGTDTGGSIRVPAAFCGLYGLRLTPHHTWIADAFPLAPSFDTAGWFTANAADMLALLKILLGVRTMEREPRGCHLGFSALGQTADAEVSAAFTRAAETFAPAADADLAADFVRAQDGAAQAYAVLQSREAHAVHAEWLDRHRDRYSPEVWARIDRGRRWTGGELESATFRSGAMRLFWMRLFLSCDYLILPATPFPALSKAECTLENRNRLLALTAPASLGGLPVLTVPVPLADGGTTGLQFVVNSVHSPVLPWALTRCAAG